MWHVPWIHKLSHTPTHTHTSHGTRTCTLHMIHTHTHTHEATPCSALLYSAKNKAWKKLHHKHAELALWRRWRLFLTGHSGTKQETKADPRSGRRRATERYKVSIYHFRYINTTEPAPRLWDTRKWHDICYDLLSTACQTPCILFSYHNE